MRDVHGRNPVVPYRPACLRGLGTAAREQDRPDHAVERRCRGYSAVRPDFDHRRCIGRYGDAALRQAIAGA